MCIIYECAVLFPCISSQSCSEAVFRNITPSEMFSTNRRLPPYLLTLCPQAVNFWQVLVMNDEHTERRYLLYFLLGWGLPALVIIILVIVLLGGFGWTIHNVYGLVQGDV